MAQQGKIYPQAEEFNRPPPPRGTYYKVQDQHLPAPSTYRRGRQGSRGCCCCLLSWLCAIITILVIAIGIAALVIWLVIHPKIPKYDIDSVHISGLNTTSLTGTSFNTEVTYNISARNPNKHVDIDYDNINVDVQTNGQTVGQGSVPGFHQGHDNTTYIVGEITTSDLSLNSGTVALLAKDLSAVPMYTEVDVKAQIKIGSWKSWKVTVEVKCNLVVNLLTSQQLTSHKCSDKVKW